MDPMQRQAMGYAPMAAGYAPQYRYGLEGAPFISSNPLVGMAASPLLMNAMGGMNMTPMGLGHDQNAWDTLKHREFTAMQRQAMSDASAVDRQSFMRTFRGVAAMSGQEFGASQRRAAGTLADAAQFAAPIMAQIAPDTLDQLGGLRGSATVMASRMIEGGRYRMDPATGRMGMSAETVGQQSRELYEKLYGDKAKIGDMKGVTAGQAGSLFQELQMRGMVDQDTRSVGTKTSDVVRGMSAEQLQKAASRQKMTLPAGGVEKLSAEDIDKLSLDPAVSEKMRSIDTGRIAKSIKNYAGAVSAMREIFGDQGRPNAPMSELMRGLEQLTGGNLAQMDPAKAGMIARQTYNLAKSTGVSIDNALMIQGHASQHAAALGIESQFGVSATQHALAFGGAYRARGEGAVTAWGAMNSDQLTQLDANLTTSASGSNMANRLGAAVRVADSVGGFKKDSEAANLIKAIKTGQKEYRGADGKFKSIALSEEDLIHTLTHGVDASGKSRGITQNDVQEMLTQQFDNREQVDKYKIGDSVRGLQGEKQVMPFLADRMHETMVEKLKAKGINEDAAKEAMGKVSAEATKQVFSMSTADFNDPQKFKANFQKIMETQLAGTDAGKALAAMPDQERNQFFGLAAERWKGQSNLALQNSGFAGLENVGNVQRIFNPETMAAADRNRQRQNFTGQLQDALSPLGKGTALSRAMQFLQNAKSTDSPIELIATAFGGVKNEDVNKALVAPLQKLQEKRAALEELQAKILKEKPGEARDKLQEQHDTGMRELTDDASNLAKVSADFGFFGETGVSAKDTKEALSAARDISREVAETAGIRSASGSQIERPEIDAVKRDYRVNKPVTTDQAAAAIIARRRETIERMRTDKSAISKEDIDATIQRRKALDRTVLSEDDARNEIINNQIATWSTKPGSRDAKGRDMSQISHSDMELEMQKGQITTDEQARAVIIAERRATGFRPPRAAVDALIKGGMSPADAEELAAARQRAKRWGFSHEIDEARKAAEAAKTPFTPADERRKLGELIDREEKVIFNVSDDDVRKANPGIKDGDIDTARKTMLEKRFQDRSDRFGEFWRTDDGKMARSSIMRSEDAYQTIADKAVTAPSAQRFGTRGIAAHTRLNDITTRKHELALKYAGGDIAKLLHGDIQTFGNKETYEKVMNEIKELQTEQGGIVGMLHDTTGKLGRQFWLGDEEQAKKDIEAKKAGETDEDYKKRVVARQEQVGNMKEAHTLMGLTDEEMKRLEKGNGEGLNPLDFARRVLLKKQADNVGIARKMTGEEEQSVRTIMAAGDKATTEQKDKMAKIATKIGVSAEALPGAIGVIEVQKAAAEKYYDRTRESGSMRLTRVGNVFGIDEAERDGQKWSALAGRIGSQSAAGTESIVNSENELKGAVQGSQKSFANVGELGKAFNDATVNVSDEKKRTENLNNLRSKLHIGDDHQWEKVKGALEVQQQQGLLERNKDGNVSLEQLNKAYTIMEQGGQRLPQADTDKGGSKWDNVKFTGTLTIKGSQAEVDGASSGNPLNPVTKP